MTDLSHSDNQPQRDQSIRIGDLVCAYDADYDENYRGRVQEIREARNGGDIVFVKNELDGAFEGMVVALAAGLWSRV